MCHVLCIHPYNRNKKQENTVTQMLELSELRAIRKQNLPYQQNLVIHNGDE